MPVVKLKEKDIIEMVMNHLKEENGKGDTANTKDDESINKLLIKLAQDTSEYEVKGKNMLIYKGQNIKILTDGVIEVGEHQFHVSQETCNRFKKIISPLMKDDLGTSINLSKAEIKFISELIEHPDLGFDSEEEEEIVKNIKIKFKQN